MSEDNVLDTSLYVPVKDVALAHASVAFQALQGLAYSHLIGTRFKAPGHCQNLYCEGLSRPFIQDPGATLGPDKDC